MKKPSNKNDSADDDDMRSEYDFSGGVRGKHFRHMLSGYTITVHQPDGKTLVKEVRPREDIVILEPDVREYFPDSKSVNSALRALIELIPKKRRVAARTKKRPNLSESNQ